MESSTDAQGSAVKPSASPLQYQKQAQNAHLFHIAGLNFHVNYRQLDLK